MTINDLTSAASVFGPTGVAILYLIYLHSKNPAQKGDDAISKLTETIAAMNVRLVRIETLMEMKGKDKE